MPDLQIPFMTGQNEGADSRALPDGGLRSVKELVMERAGRLTQRKAYTAVTASAPASALTDEVWSIGEFGEQRLLTTDRPPSIVTYRPDTNNFDEQSLGTTPLYLPAFNAAQRQHIPHDLGTAAVDVERTDCCLLNGLLVVVWELGDDIGATIILESTQAVLFSDVVLTASSGLGFPKLCAAGDYVALVYVTGTTVLARMLDTTDTTSPRFGNSVTLGSTHAVTLPCHLATCEIVDSDSDFIVAWYYSGPDPTVVRVQRHTGATVAGGSGTAEASDDVTLNSGSNNTPALDICSTDGEVCFLGYGLLDDNEVGVATTDSDIAAAFTTVAATTTATSLLGNVGIVRASSTSARFFWSYHDATEIISGIISYVATSNEPSAPSLATARPHYGLRPCSKPFRADGQTYVVASRDSDNSSPGSADWTTSYYLVRLGESSGAVDPQRIHGFFGRSRAHYTQGETSALTTVNNVVTDGSGNFIWSGLVLTQGHAFDRITPGQSTNVRVGSAVWRWSSDTRDKFGMVTLGRSLYLSGGVLMRWNGAFVTQAGFLARPDVKGLSASNGAGALNNDGVYSWIVTYETVNNDGEIARSEPSLAADHTIGATDDTVELTIRDDPTRSLPLGLANTDSKLYVYRTEDNTPGTYYLAHAIDAPTDGNAITVSTHPTFTDLEADGTINARITLYSDGSSAPVNAIPPPCRFLARVGKRLVAGGTEDPKEVWFSAEHVEGEQVNWHDESAYKIQLPSACTAVGELDNYPVLFTADGIFTVRGPGPAPDGTGTYELAPLPTEFGAITHFVAKCDAGLCFQSKRGIEVLPRGFGPPVWIGRAVADTLGTDTITSAVTIEHDKSVRFTCSSGVLVWNTTWNFWSVFELGDIKSAGSWGGYHVVAEDTWTDGAPQLESSTTVTSVSTVNPLWETGAIKLGAISGFYRARVLALVFRWYGKDGGGAGGGVTVTLDVSRDGGQTWATADQKAWELQDTTTDSTNGYTDGDEVTLRYSVRGQKSDTFRFRVTVSEWTEGATTSQGRLEWLGASLTYLRKPGVKRVKAEARG